MPRLIVNNQEVETDLPPGSSLVDFLRGELRLHGTRIGCREGDCGACTVLVGELEGGVMRYRTMASCLLPLGNAEGRHLVTIEGINQEELSFIQEAFVEMNGTQCGFCTPGFILSVYGFCLGQRPFTLEDAAEAISGNICRCTGYASIKRAVAAIVARIGAMDRRDPVGWMVANGFLPAYFQGIPARLQGRGPAREVPAAGYVLAGGTDLLIQDFDGARDAGAVRLLSGAPGLRELEVDAGRCTLGAACTLNEVMESPALNRVLPGLRGHLRLMASHPIRNMGTVGGNLANASPLGDLCVILMGLGATLVLARGERRREVALRDFYTGYKRTVLEPDELIECAWFETPGEGTRFSFEKASKRRHLDMATVNSSLRVELLEGAVVRATLAAGSLGPSVARLAATSSFLEGRRLDDATFREAERIAQTEIAPLSRHPGDGEYKRALLRQQLLLHFMACSPGTATLEALR